MTQVNCTSNMRIVHNMTCELEHRNRGQLLNIETRVNTDVAIDKINVNTYSAFLPR